MFLRAGVRGGVEVSEYDTGKDRAAGIAHALTASAYGEAQLRPRGVAAGVVADVPLKDARGHQVAGGVAVAATGRLSLGAGYYREQVLGESDDNLRLGAEYRPTRGVALQAEAQLPGPGRGFAGVYQGRGFLQLEI